MKIKVSIIIPFYTVCERFLRECLNSIIAQDMQEMECLLVSDGAPEKEESICKEYCAKDSRFRFINKEHGGVSAARNLGIKEAQGEYVTFVDADDWIDQNTCTLVYTKAVKSRSDIILWECTETSESGKKTNALTFDVKEKKEILSQIFVRNSNSAILAQLSVCKLFKRNFLYKNNLNYNDKLIIEEDTVFNFQAISKGSISILHISLYYWRKHANSACHKYRPNHWTILYEALCTYKKIAPNYKREISGAALLAFFECWSKCFFNKSNPQKTAQRVYEIKKLWNSPELQNLLTNLCLKDFPFIFKIETWFLQHKIYTLLWIHAIKNKFFRSN